jgi:poly-gamma-glutamate synthesis protein (capsule biosynthesis protein)
MKNNHYTLYTVLFLIISCAFVSTVYYQQKTNALVIMVPAQEQVANVLISDVGTSSKPIQSKNTNRITFIAVGDIMVHQDQLNSAYDKKTDSYDFSEYFKNINSYLKDGDMVYANLETSVAGKELKYSGYPKFNAPTELLEELKKNNFTHLSVANNHALDRGWVGLSNTIRNVKDAGMIPLGAREVGASTSIQSSPQKNTSIDTGAVTAASSSVVNYQITEKNGVKVGFLSYTYDTNGFTLPKNKKGMISYIDKEQIVKDLDDVKKQGVDVIIVAYHFGVEYQKFETSQQRELGQLACDNGANFIIGTHPHVLEPVRYLTNSNDKNSTCMIAYSLGNFISGMPNLYTDLGGILKIKISKMSEATEYERGRIGIIKKSFMGTWVKRGLDQDGRKYFTVVPMQKELIPTDIEVTTSEAKRLDIYRNFVHTKIDVELTNVE